MGVVQPLPAGPRGSKTAEAVPHPFPGQVLDLSVVFMASAVLAHLGDAEIADSTQPRGQIVHAGNAIVQLMPGLRQAWKVKPKITAA
jgi:hypothetical protein